MGKGTRNRQERFEDRAANPQNYVKKKKNSKNYTPLIATLCVVLAVLIVGGLLLGANGTFMRMKTAAESDEFKINGAMMTYMVHATYNNYISNAQQTYSSLLSSLGSTYTIYDLIGLNPNVSLKKQKMPNSEQTWFDNFASGAKSEAERILVYCRAAKAEGIELDDEDLQSVESSISLIRLYAQYYGYSTQSYINMTYGKGVRERDIRGVMRLSALASKFAEKLDKDFREASTDETVMAFYEKNSRDYLTADYLSYNMKATKATLKDGATDEEKAEAEKSYEDLKASIKAASEKLKGYTTVEEFKEYVKSYWITSNKEEYRTKYYDEYLKEAEGETDEERAAAAEKKLEEKLLEDGEKIVEALPVENYSYHKDTKVSEWIFGDDDKEAAKAFSTFQEVDEDKEKGTYSVTTYMLTREAGRSEILTRNIAYLLLPSGSYKEDEAKAAKELFASKTVGKDALLALAEDYPNNAGCTTVEDLKKGAFGFDELDEWLFDDARAAGDYELITCKYNNTTYYMLVYLESIGKAEWYVDCLDDLVSENISDWYDEASKTYPVSISDSVINGVKM